MAQKGNDMARIPLGSFGNVIAQPAPAVRVTAAAFDNGGSGPEAFGDDCCVSVHR